MLRGASVTCEMYANCSSFVPTVCVVFEFELLSW
jgi:hypothetical protein